MTDNISDFAAGLLEAANEAAAYMRGEATGAVTHEVSDAKTIRTRIEFTQEQMAPLLGMSLSGYRKLEQGQRSVSGAAQVLLRVLDKEPDAVVRALKAG